MGRGAASGRVARRAAEIALGSSVTRPHRIASGHSCVAYVVRDGDRPWVVRVPVQGTDRTIRFHAEAALGALLAAHGHPVATWTVVDVDGIACAVGQQLGGSPITAGTAWSPAFSAGLGDLLADLHRLPAAGFGPLADDPTELRGQSPSARAGVRERWRRSSCWPFDGSDLAGHPVSRLLPDAAPAVAPLRPRLLDVAQGPFGVVHSDLHHEHLLAGPGGELTGVLDFGDAFVGSVAWDFALLHWYYGPDVSVAVARRHPDGSEIDDRGRLLAVALGMYKLAKSPADPRVPPRLRRVLRELH